MMNIRVKFHSNPSTRYGNIVSRVKRQRTAAWRTAWKHNCFSLRIVGGKT